MAPQEIYPQRNTQGDLNEAREEEYLSVLFLDLLNSAWTLSSASQGIRCQILHNEDDAVYHSGLSGGGKAKYDLQLATDGGNDCPSRLNGKANLPSGTQCVEIKNAGVAEDAMAVWASYQLYCL